MLVFLPQIALLFLFIGLLEDSGYMARAAFLMDRVMRRVGLHGKSFIPMLSGYACAVPGIMATRTIENEQGPAGDDHGRAAHELLGAPAGVHAAHRRLRAADRVLGGVLTLQGLTMLGMYFLGTVTALAAAALFKRTLLRGPGAPDDPRAAALPVAERRRACWSASPGARRCSCAAPAR